MNAPPTRQLAHLTWTEVRDLSKDPGVVLLPIGAVEQHGPHLPTITDNLIVNRVVDAALAQLAADVAAWVLPPLHYGKSTEHTNFPGTITLSADTLRAVVMDIGHSVARAGFRRLAFVNGHGGNTALLEVLARDLRAETGLLCFCIQPALFVKPPFAISPQEERFGFHAGEIETSLLLDLAPELVHMDQALCHFPDFPQSDGPLFYFGGASTAWLTQDWSASGVFGDATLGTAAKGTLLLDSAARIVAQVVTTISTFEIPAANPFLPTLPGAGGD